MQAKNLSPMCRQIVRSHATGLKLKFIPATRNCSFLVSCNVLVRTCVIGSFGLLLQGLAHLCSRAKRFLLASRSPMHQSR